MTWCWMRKYNTRLINSPHIFTRIHVWKPTDSRLPFEINEWGHMFVVNNFGLYKLPPKPSYYKFHYQLSAHEDLFHFHWYLTTATDIDSYWCDPFLSWLGLRIIDDLLELDLSRWSCPKMRVGYCISLYFLNYKIIWKHVIFLRVLQNKRI